ncbi:MAG: hypothetical protein E6G92_02315 [Alphaproteobacteria bacterium]|nr:MAG: hypothetical protein E6G92_02315 [Alphaproteobacteria bacterium]
MAGAARLTFGFALALAALLLPGAASAADLLLGPESGFTIPVELGGATLRLRVDPAASGLVILNPDAVARARLTPEMMRGRPGIPGQYIRPSYARIGPVALAGRTRAVTARLAGQALRIQAIWFDRAVIDGADGLISPALLPYDSITFRLGAARAGESAASLALDFVTGLGLYFPYPLEGRALPVQFSLWKPSSIATAAAGALLAQARGGAWAGDPGRRAVSFGILRPVRPMQLRRPLDLGFARVGLFLVRTGDYGGGLALPAETEADPDEIVVTAARAAQVARLNLVLGADQFAACSSLRYQRAERRLTLICPGATPAPQRPRERFRGPPD